MTVIKKYDGIAWQEVVVGESGQWNSAQTIRAETASTVLTSADAGSVIAMNSSSATAITVNGSTSFSPGQRVDFLRQGTGDVTIYGSGVTINGTPGSKLRARYSGASLLCIRPNVYVLTGDLDEAFSPLSLAPTLWLDAADTSTVTVSSTLVSEWRDKSGNNRHVAQSSSFLQPKSGTVARNGLNVLDFDGSDTLFANSVSGLPSDATTMFLVVERVSTSSSGFSAVLRSSTSDLPVFGHADYKFFRRNNVGDTFFTTSSSNTGWQYVTCFYDGTNIEHRNNGVQIAASTQGGAATFDHIRIGASPYSSGDQEFSNIGLYFLGRISEVIIISRAVNTAERAQMESYLSARWSI